MSAMEWLDFTGGGYTHKVYKRGKAPKENTNESEKEAQLLVQQATDSMAKTLTLVSYLHLHSIIVSEDAN